MHEARLYEKLPDGKVHCHLCGHRCIIPLGEFGVCQVRENRDGTLVTLVYGCAISQQVDPVEKKPLYHFLPGSLAFSVATVGCNMQCQWCQNWQIAQASRTHGLMETRHTSPEELVANARANRSHSIAYTYTEPTIFFEYAYDTARLAHAAGIANLYITNGYMTGEMLDLIHPYLDAANVDLKSFRQRTYTRYTGAGLQPVLDSLKKIKDLGIWLEVTTLIVPGVNDDPAELTDMAAFIAGELGTDTPWHLSRFFPHYHMPDTPPTPPSILRTAFEIGKRAGLQYVYLGNVAGETHTDCPGCGQTLIRRSGYTILTNRLANGCCPACGQAVSGVWEFSLIGK
jgi:pyruvate formate lyase activating enzyme